MGQNISIAVVDNDPWSLRSISRWIDGSSPLHHVIWQTTSAAEAVHRCLYTSGKPDVLMLDMALNDASGLSVCAQIRKHTAEIGIIGMTAYDSKRYESDLAQAGAQALIAKEDLTTDCQHLLSLVAQGKSADQSIFPSATQAHAMLTEQSSSFSLHHRLSARELQILRLYARDIGTAHIASQLGIAPNTVFTYIHRISKKLGVSNRLEAIQACKKFDLL